ncbi:MAG: glycosyltransferase family 39 protein [Pirellulales bacterium]|nr:glycosyltransferase family 39 protein [Pirellulales bacterium]
MSWDEGNAIRRAEGIAAWATLATTGEDDPFSSTIIGEHWRYTTTIEGHPAFYGIVITAGRALGERWLPPLAAARLGPILLFSLAVGCAAWRLAGDYSRVAAIAGSVALVTMPRLFAHAHYASFDGPLTSCWLIAWAFFEPARRGGWRFLPFGVALGTTLACKSPGWFAPLAFLLVSLVTRDRAGIRASLAGMLLALGVFWLLNPPLWHDPIGGFQEFVVLNTGRADRPQHNISTWFLGRMHNLDYPLPWYNTLLWTAIAVPLGTLALALVGIGHAARSGERETWLLVGCWGTLVLVRATPFAPPHDGLRLFLPSFAFLACLAGVGFDRLWRRFARRDLEISRGRLLLRRTLLALPLAAAAGSTAWYWPQELSYYNLAIGGLRGATALGMEPTYYWDSLDRHVFAWLDANTAPDEKILFGAAPPENLALLREWGTLRRGYRAADPGRYRWYVIQLRPSGWRDFDRWLLAHEQPAYQHTIRPSDRELGPWSLDVPLLNIYTYEQYERARAAVQIENSPAS